MPTTVSGGFNALRDRLALTTKQTETADARTTALKTFLRSEFSLAETPILVGSYARRTIVSPEKDIDLLVPFFYPDYKETAVGDDSRALLYMVRNALNERYSSTKVSSQEVAVKLNFTDITVDVVPCFPRSGGGYLVANGYKGWRSTNPPFHTAHMKAANAASGDKLKIIVRLMKYWNLVNGRHLSSLHVELMVAEMWKDKNMSGSDVSALLASTLNAMPSWVRSTFDDPWSDGGRIDGYLNGADRQTAINLLTSDAKASAAAEEYRSAGNIPAAYERWNVVFRQKFPAYG